MPPLNARSAILGVAGLALLGVTTGCTATTEVPTVAAGTATATPAPATTAASPDANGEQASGAGTSRYADGIYQATGPYQSPGGSESIDVEIALKDDIVTAVEIAISNADNASARRHENEFREVIGGLVVGRSLDTLEEFSRVGGSSLTSAGFNKAIEQIKAEALS